MSATHKWLFGAVAAAVLVAAGGWFLLISPKRAEVADLQTQTQAQAQENAGDRTELEVLKQQNKDLPEKQAELAALRTKIPEAEELSTYIRELQTIAGRSNVVLTGMAPASAVTLGAAATTVEGAAAPLTPGELAAVNVDLTLTGSFDGIKKFVNDLETADRYTLSSGVTITDEEDTEATDEGQHSKDGVLTATINARIFMTPVVDPAATTATIPGTPAATTAPTPTATPAP